MKPRSSRRFLHSLPLRSFNVAFTFASKPLLLAVACSLGAVSLSSIASAAIFTYDANTSTTGAQDGAGAGWNVAANPANWWDGAADVQWSTANTLTDTAIFGAGGTGGTVVVGTVNVGTIQFNATTTTGYTLSTGTITLGTGIVNNNAALGSTISAKISGSAGLAYSGTGTGTVTLSNNVSGGNDYTGITSLTGTGRLANGGRNTAFGSSAGASASALGLNYTQIGTGTGVSLSGGTLVEAFIINGSGQANQGALRFVNNTTLDSLIRLGSSSRIAGAFSSGNVINGNIDLQSFTLTLADMQGSINGAISGTGGLSLSTNSTNPLILTNSANSFSGNLSINGSAVLGVGNNTALGGSTIVFAGGGIQSIDATARTIANTIGTLTGNAAFGQTSTQTGTLSFATTTTASLGNSVRTFTTNVNTTFANGFSSTGSIGGITKAGIGTLIMNGTSTYSGTTTVSAGTLLISGINSGSGAVDVGASGKLGGIGTIAGGVNVTGVLSPGASIESLSTGTVAFASGSKLTYELQDTSSVGADLVDITGNLSLAGTVTLDLVKLGAGTWAVGDKLTILSYTGSITANSFFNFVDGGDGKLTDDETFSFDGAEWVFDYNDL
ncbi:autotransporter-associated beta strand repeat-containing protein, partial [bacterium]|nr:autotransporter-associated beta strand repeat-containing protein [bacterium]